MTCRVYFHVIDSGILGWSIYVGSILTSLCSLGCMGVVFSNGILHQCAEQLIILATAWVAWRFLWEPLTSNSIECHPVRVLESPFGEKRQTAVVLSPSLFGGFIRITSICYREVSLYKVSIPPLRCPSILTDPPLIPSLNPIPLPLLTWSSPLPHSSPSIKSIQFPSPRKIYVSF